MNTNANIEFALIEDQNVDAVETSGSIELSLTDLDVVAGGAAIVGFY